MDAQHETHVVTSSTPAVDTPDHSRRNTVVIALMLAATFVVFLNETIIGVALPRLMEDLRIEPSTAQWLSTAFMLTMAIVIPVTGFLMQRLNTRTVFILAMSLFSAGTAIAAVAPGFELLLAGRIVQAAGTAIMLPLLMTTVMTLVPPHSRGRVMGNISIVMSVAPAVGPAIGGIILDALDWRWIFILVLPVAIAALAMGAMRVQNVTTPTKAPVDVLSIILSAFAFGGLVYGLSLLGESAAGTAPIAPWIPIIVGVISLALFVWRQLMLQRSDRALLDLRTFTRRGFAVAIVLMAVMMATLFGTIILLPIYTQDVLGLSPTVSGLLVVPGSLLMGLMGPVVGRLYDKVGPRPLLVPASILVSASLWSFTFLSETTPWYVVIVMHVALSIGLAFMFTPLFTSGLGALPPNLYSHGSATIGTVQQLAGAAGTALFIALLTAGEIMRAAEGADDVIARATGVHWAFLAGAIISLFAIVITFFVPKPDPELAGTNAHGGH
ncbi:DHA2 family efflux MFS transporter permease subunit [Leifsonia sp. AK011]|uniref:DHA2 family efflux MFS transporter permease subunit n=1 Tax=Leifsonia sp. AK011 TaxID=2723075 RepID=UPI0015CB772E|nr:DHA2 family efflux MFS transporter permease subunit [Leifsonia sp. AK011]